MQKKPVTVVIHSTIHPPVGSSEQMQLLTHGTLSGSRDHWQLEYTETDSDDAESRVVLTMNKGVVTMERDGAYSTSMVFSKGQRYEGTYSTPFGTMDMDIISSQVDYDISNGAGGIALRYQVDLEGQYAAMHRLNITFTTRTQS